MSRKRKYKRGCPYSSVEELLIDMAAGKNVYILHKVYTVGWYQNFTLKTIVDRLHHYSKCVPLEQCEFEQLSLDI